MERKIKPIEGRWDWLGISAGRPIPYLANTKVQTTILAGATTYSLSGNISINIPVLYYSVERISVYIQPTVTATGDAYYQNIQTVCEFFFGANAEAYSKKFMTVDPSPAPVNDPYIGICGGPAGANLVRTFDNMVFRPVAGINWFMKSYILSGAGVNLTMFFYLTIEGHYWR